MLERGGVRMNDCTETPVEEAKEAAHSGPGFVSYTRDTFKNLVKQHNIMVLVGNGFDIQVLHEYGQPVDTRYEPFYHHLKMRGFTNENVLVKKMEDQLSAGREDWSDVEAAVAGAVEDGQYSHGQILADLRALQAQFAEFLQGVVPAALLGRLGADAMANHWSVRSLSEFLGDISDPVEFRSMRLPAAASSAYHLYNFLFVNFNYTTLLDNFVYLDQVQFDPLRNKTVDTHFSFRNDPNGYLSPDNKNDQGQSSYVLVDVVHPHGVISTPRSLLFGVDGEDDYDKVRKPEDKLKKPYWAQGNVRYRKHFAQTEMFVIFGCSLGSSDGWWWRQIGSALRRGSPELLIYKRRDGSRYSADSVRARFIEVARLELTGQEREAVEQRIHVILYDDDTDRNFLSTRRSMASSDGAGV